MFEHSICWDRWAFSSLAWTHSFCKRRNRISGRSKSQCDLDGTSNDCLVKQKNEIQRRMIVLGKPVQYHRVFRPPWDKQPQKAEDNIPEQQRKEILVGNLLEWKQKQWVTQKMSKHSNYYLPQQSASAHWFWCYISEQTE